MDEYGFSDKRNKKRNKQKEKKKHPYKKGGFSRSMNFGKKKK